MGSDRRGARRRQRPQPRRAHLGALQPRRRRRPGRRQVGLVARGHAARDDAQPGRRAVGRAALHRAARPDAARSTATAGRAPTSCVTSRTPAPRTPMQMDCAALPGAIPENYDCGHDDYFNPAPAAGSYLATHWNTYDSVFLAPCGEIAPACGGGNLWVPTPPAATRRADRARQRPPRHRRDRPAGHVGQRAARLRVPVAAPDRRRLGGHRRRDRPALPRRPATTSGCACASWSWPPTPTAARAPPPPRRCRSAARASTARRARATRARRAPRRRPRPRRSARSTRSPRTRSPRTRQGPQAPVEHNGGVADSLRGKLILASPVLRDPNFSRTVVLIAEHTDEGAMGLVLNRPASPRSARPYPTSRGWPATASRCTSAARSRRPR